MAENLKIYYFNHHFPPIHYLQIAIPKGSFYEPLEKRGISEILLANLFLYSKKYGLKELKTLFDILGANYQISAQEESITLSLAVMKENFEKALTLFLDALFFPQFSKIKFKSSKKLAIGSLKVALTDPQIVSEYHLFNLVFGKNHPLGKNQTIKTIKKINFDDLEKEYENLIKTKNWGIYISSPNEKEEIIPKTLEVFKNYNLKNLNSYNLDTLPFQNKTKIRIIPKKGLSQVSINLLIPSEPRNSENYLPLKISFYSFAEGGFSSRILRKIRVEMGSTYGVLGSYEAFKEIGYFQISGMVKNNDFPKAVEIIKKMYEEWREEGIKKEELEEARAFYLKNFETLKDDPLDWGGFVLKNHIYNFPENYAEILVEKLKNINLKNITQANNKLLPKIPFWTFLGDRKIIEPLASSLGEAEIKSYYDFE